jgi:hypothetical protein
VRYSGWWLIGDCGALAAALRKENVEDGMRSEMARGDRSGYIWPQASRFMPIIRIVHLKFTNPRLMTRVPG